MAKTYVQSVDGVVNLIGGPEVGLTGLVNTGLVIVREAAGDEEIGWVDDGEKFVPATPPAPSPVVPDTGPMLMDIMLKQAELEQKIDAIGIMLVPPIPEV